MLDKILDPPVLSLLLIFGSPFVFVIGMLGYKMYETHKNSELKRAMVERGYTADEIERVLQASQSKTAKKE